MKPSRYHPARLLPACVAAALFSAPLTQAQSPGAIVSPSGVLLKDGKPYRAIGGSAPFDSMEWYEFGGEDHLQTFADMKASGMKIIRLTANGYWNYWKVSSLYNTDRTAYFQKMDAMISAAAQNDIGVVLGIFWGIHPPPGEMFMAATVPRSKTYLAMAAFARDLEEHYKDNPTVLGFDVIGELNLNPDQPNGGQAVNERWTSESIQVVYENLCNAVHSVDPKRMLSSGNGPKSESVKTPRPSRQENQQIP